MKKLDINTTSTSTLKIKIICNKCKTPLLYSVCIAMVDLYSKNGHNGLYCKKCSYKI